jgi:hypothetical protein
LDNATDIQGQYTVKQDLRWRRSLPLHWRTAAQAVVYLFAPEPAAPEVAVHTGAWCIAELISPEGLTIGRSQAPSPYIKAAAPAQAGIWTLTVELDTQAEGQAELEAEVPLWVEARHAFPFVVPGPGIVPSHFPYPQPALRLAALRHPADIWMWVPPGLPKLTVQTSLALDRISHYVSPTGEQLAFDWQLPPKVAYHSAEVPAPPSGWWRIPIGAGPAGRLTTWEGAPLASAKGPDFPGAQLRVQPLDSAGEAIAARVELYRGQERWAAYDCMPGEKAELYTIPGPATVRVSQGMNRQPQVVALDVAPGAQELQVALLDALLAAPGWIAGEHHVHSHCEDGANSPLSVVRAGAAQGLDYLFITDEPEPLLEAGIQTYNVPGRFLALPGQECGNPDCHCNALNTRQTMACPQFGTFPQHYQGPGEWLPQVAAQSREKPAIFMLNHPSHMPAAMRGPGYFRSWGQADAHPEIRLLENVDFASWFARLNAGRRLTVLWTTDAHDMAWLPAGAKRSYVYVSDAAGRPATEWDERDIIAALQAGRVFCTRDPGALLYLTVNGKRIGEEVRLEGQPALLEITCQASRPLRLLELVVNGEVQMRWPGAGALEYRIKQRLTLPASGWLLARAYVHEEPIPRDGHRMEPLTAAGCIAFTNPVYLA